MMRILMLWWFTLSAAFAGDGFDHSHAQLGTFYGAAVSNAGLDYGDLSKRRGQLDAYLSQLEEAPVSEFSRSQKIAFWVNAYNAFTIRLILDEKQPKSIMGLDGGKVWDTRKYKVAGQQLTLNDMEHKRARPLTDGRVHAALNCASKGCPPLGPKPFRAATVEAQLDEAARRWVATNAYVQTGNAVTISHIFEWFADDFKGWRTEAVPGVGVNEGAALRFIVQYGDASAKGLVQAGMTVTYHEYDWSLNRR